MRHIYRVKANFECTLTVTGKDEDEALQYAKDIMPTFLSDNIDDLNLEVVEKIVQDSDQDID